MRKRSNKQGSRPSPALLALALATLCLGAGWSEAATDLNCKKGPFTRDFRTDECTFSNTGRTPFLVLEPGYWLNLEGEEDGIFLQVIITVLPDTEMVDGVLTRVVEERESEDGELVEVSRNFIAICAETGSTFYFGEDVDDYDNGMIVGHGGAWRAGVDGAEPGILIPSEALLGARYFQEVAPGLAMDRACHAAVNRTFVSPAGTFTGCTRTVETSPLAPGDVSIKVHCPGIGMVFDDGIELVDWSEAP